MLLTIDVGNTNMVFGIYEKDTLKTSFRLTTKASRTPDELGLTLMQYFQARELDAKKVEGIVIGSVVPDVMPTLSRAIISYFGKKPLIVYEDIFPHLRYKGEGQLGADRAISCEAALAKYGAPIVVVDLGTATTMDAVDDTRLYLGGNIFAGLKTSADALHARASMLPPIDLVLPENALEYTTVTQMQAGTIGLYIGGVDYLLNSIIAEMPFEKVTVVATGGFSQLMASHVKTIDFIDENLILEGLRIMYERHVRAVKSEE